MPSREPHGPLPALLLVLTVVTGLVDAVSYLGLGRVFVANQTGNVVFLGLTAAGAADVSLATSLVAIAAFFLAGVLGGRVVRRRPHRGRLLAAATALELVLVLGSIAVAPHIVHEPARLATIALLSMAMGLQTAVARGLGVPDLLTTILTMTLTGLAADSALAGGTDARFGRRLAAIVAMLAGAFAGGVLTVKVGVVAALGAAAILLAVACAIATILSREDAGWTESRASSRA